MKSVIFFSNFDIERAAFPFENEYVKNLKLGPAVTYRISSFSFRWNYSFLNLEIIANSNSCRNISILYLINWFLDAETIQGRKLYEEIRYVKISSMGKVLSLHMCKLLDRLGAYKAEKVCSYSSGFLRRPYRFDKLSQLIWQLHKNFSSIFCGFLGKSEFYHRLVEFF